MKNTEGATKQEDYSAWTPCEMYGCNFVTDEDSGVVYCTDCGESYTLDKAIKKVQQ